MNEIEIDERFLEHCHQCGPVCKSCHKAPHWCSCEIYNPDTHVAVPREPTEAMFEAGSVAAEKVWIEREGSYRELGLAEIERYKAMIAAEENDDD